MRVTTVEVENFRSVKSASLSNCGGFNVLIGKNNSGKSNLLSAISVFFGCITDGNVVAIRPPIGRTIDFFNRVVESPIRVRLHFRLDESERDRLVDGISDEAPRVRNAAESLPSSLMLAVRVTVVANPARFSYVDDISVYDALLPDDQPFLPFTILNITESVAIEMYEQASRYQQLLKDLEALRRIDERFDSSTWNVIQAERDVESRSRIRTTPRYAFRSLLPGSAVSDLSDDVERELTTLISRSKSEEDFVAQMRAITSRVRSEVESIESEPLQGTIGTFAGNENSVPSHIRALLGQLHSSSVLYLTERREPIGAQEARRLLDLKVTRGGTERLRSIQDAVSSLLGVQVDAFQAVGDSRVRQAESSAELDVDNFLVQANGSGIKEALRLILDFEFQRPSVLLVEEPETHLHPALETAMMRYLQSISSECQVFLTTHSTNFLDSAIMSNVYLVTKGAETDVVRLNVDDAVVSVPRELGMRLSSFFMFDRLVFVEGKSDEEILRELAAISGINLSHGNVGFVPMGGVRSFGHFANQEVLSFLTRRLVDIRFVLDRDEREDLEVTRLQERIGDQARMHVLRRREIENYLLVPRVVVELIRYKWDQNPSLSAGRQLPTVVELQGVIDSEADKLQRFVINKRLIKEVCKPAYPNLSAEAFESALDQPAVDAVTREITAMMERLKVERDRVAAVFADTSERVESLWSAEKLSLVPGDVLLDKICQRYGVRFRKERDGGWLASNLERSEIAAELTELLHDIGRVRDR